MAIKLKKAAGHRRKVKAIAVSDSKPRLLGITILGKVVRQIHGEPVTGVVLKSTVFTRLANSKAKSTEAISRLRTQLKTMGKEHAKRVATLSEHIADVEYEERIRTRQLEELQTKFDNLQRSKNLLLRNEEIRLGKLKPDGTKSTADYNSVTSTQGWKHKVGGGLGGVGKK